MPLDIAAYAAAGAELRVAFLRDAEADLRRVAETIAAAFRAGGKVLAFGNGGSAADAQHLAAELVGRFRRKRAALPAIALTTDTSILTSVGNDFSFDEVFARQIEAFGNKGDIAWAISTSGNSPNVLRGIEAARARGLSVVGLTGGDGGAMASRCDTALIVPTRETPLIQELHVTILHVVCELLDEVFAAK